MKRRPILLTAIAVAASLTMTAASGASSLAYTTAPIKLGKAEARAGEALLKGAAYIEAAPADGVIAIQLEKFDPAVAEVRIDGFGYPVTVTDSAVLYLPAAKAGVPLRRTLDYTVRYTATVVPGFRPAPLRISVMP